MPTRAKLVIEPIQAAWIAGFFDGEAYVGVIRCFQKKYGRHHYRVQLSVGQVSREPLDIIQKAFGFGRLYFRRNEHQDFWYWRVTGEKAYEALTILLPYLVVKRKHADLILQFGAISAQRMNGTGRFRQVPDEIQAHRAAIWAALVELNGGRALQAERLSEKAPVPTQEDAIVRPHGNENHESCQEIGNRLPN